MRRLRRQIHLAILSALGLLVLLAGLVFHYGPPDEADRATLASVELVLGEWLPGPDRPDAELQAALERLGARLGADLAVRDRTGRLRAAVGDPPPDRRAGEAGWHVRRAGASGVLSLPGGRRLSVRLRTPPGVSSLLTGLLLVAVAVGLAAWPVARGLTRRLERLRHRVEALGRGQLSARVEVEGADEVAALAESFNDAADRIERLVSAQRTLLASASHELRTPLARLRVGLELLGEGRPDLRDRLAADVEELDDRVGELLLASRAEAWDELARGEPVELLALLAEEAARSGAEVSGRAVSVEGDPVLLRHLIRHLLQNAQRHAAGAAVETRAEPRDNAGALLVVEDRGPGVPEAERERIFEPWYRPPGSSGSGVGIGLALVRRIAERHGGTARCLPREGGGTRFEVELG